VLNRATEISAEDIETFDRDARALLPPLQCAFPWVRITVKMHTLSHHAPVFFRGFCSLGVYGEQALEAWHWFFNHFQAQLTAESFLGSCLMLVQRAAIACEPGADAALDNGQHRKPAKPGRRRATNPGDRRLRANKTHVRDTAAGTLGETQDMQA